MLSSSPTAGRTTPFPHAYTKATSPKAPPPSTQSTEPRWSQTTKRKEDIITECFKFNAMSPIKPTTHTFLELKTLDNTIVAFLRIDNNTPKTAELVDFKATPGYSGKDLLKMVIEKSIELKVNKLFLHDEAYIKHATEGKCVTRGIIALSKKDMTYYQRTIKSIYEENPSLRQMKRFIPSELNNVDSGASQKAEKEDTKLNQHIALYNQSKAKLKTMTIEQVITHVKRTTKQQKWLTSNFNKLNRLLSTKLNKSNSLQELADSILMTIKNIKNNPDKKEDFNTITNYWYALGSPSPTPHAALIKQQQLVLQKSTSTFAQQLRATTIHHYKDFQPVLNVLQTEEARLKLKQQTRSRFSRADRSELAEIQTFKHSYTSNSYAWLIKNFMNHKIFELQFNYQ
ncbi:hypothetical protein DID76_03950 [Candidatus Marinamargulisbacteria bacterium SCGC AG-414-C22]|nr:hypothetical protein DID76_03950 [Candidatus Marinamargulisbacteria bacterium SCGC AG-414-C22]